MPVQTARPRSTERGRTRQNHARSTLLLIGAVSIIFPFAAAWAYCLAHGVRYVLPPGNARVSVELVLWLAAPMLVIPVVLFARLAFSPLRAVWFCGPVAFRTPALEARELLEGLAAEAGLPAPRLYVLETTTPNAFVAGMRPSQGMVVVTRGLLNLLSERELKAVLAHELTLLRNRDTYWNTTVASLVQFLRLPFRAETTVSKRRRGEAGSHRNPFGIPMLLFAPAIVLAGPPLAVLLGATANAGRKLDADREAAELTDDPEALLGALVKIDCVGSSIPESDPIVAHMYFADPGPRKAGITKGQLFTTHPPAEERIAALEEMAGFAAAATIKAAKAAGRDYASWKAQEEEFGLETQNSSQELALLAEGSRAFEAKRISEGAKVYDGDGVDSAVVGDVKRGDLVIAINESGHMQQIITSDGQFGFVPRRVKLQATDRLPQDVLHGTDVTPPEFLRLRPPVRGLTNWQITLASVFGFAVFVTVVTALTWIKWR